MEFLSLEVLVRIGIYLGVAVIVTIGYTLAVKRLLARKSNGKKSQTIYRLLLSLGKYVTWFIVILLILETFDVQTAPILASAGVLGIAIGFGAQSIVADMIAGFFILFEETFLVGDVIEVHGFRGEVMEIGLRTTKIRSWDGVLKIFTNADIKAVSNFSRYPSLAIVDFQVSYETNLSNLTNLMNEFIASYQHDNAVEPPSFMGVVELADSGVTCRVVCRSLPNNHHAIGRDLRLQVKEFLNTKGIEIPYPHIVIQEKSS
jgi:moderate conductance mechanosensitive channel